MIEWEEPREPPVSAAIIAAAERRLGVQFPRDLVRLWLTGDGLQPVRSAFYETADPTAALMDTLSRLIRFDELSTCHEALSEYVPEGTDVSLVIPVGDTGDGFICLDYRADGAAPAVVDYSMSFAETLDESADPLLPVSGSFEGFLTLFR